VTLEDEWHPQMKKEIGWSWVDIALTLGIVALAAILAWTFR
jgi:hypothetical protein